MDDLARWLTDAARNGWTLPFKAPWPLRLPVIRSVRVIWHRIQTERHYQRWAMLGALTRSGYDEWVIYAIGRGWA